MITIIECNVWCVAHSEKEQDLLNVPEGDMWMPLTFDLREIAYIKLAGETDFIGDDKAVIAFKGGFDLTIDIPYNEMVAKWKEFNIA
jgi:hypothetical protein